MTGESVSNLDFVYAIHFPEYAEDIGRELIADQVPEVVAIEWAKIADDQNDVEAVLRQTRKRFDTLTNPSSSHENALRSISKFGQFYGRLLQPLVASGVRVELLDVFENPDLGRQIINFAEVEQSKILPRAVSEDSQSLEARKQIISSLARKGAALSRIREDVVIRQLRELSERATNISVFQGIAHQAVAGTMETEGSTVSRSFIPKDITWPDSNGQHQPGLVIPYFNLIRWFVENPEAEDAPNSLVERALLGEYLLAYLVDNPRLNTQVGGQAGALIATARIISSLDQERVSDKLKAAVKSSRTGTPMAKVIQPILPKHSLKVLA